MKPTTNRGTGKNKNRKRRETVRKKNKEEEEKKSLGWIGSRESCRAS